MTSSEDFLLYRKRSRYFFGEADDFGKKIKLIEP